MKRNLFVFGLVLTLAVAALATTRTASVTLKGYIVDNACASSHTGDMEFAKGHPISCALMPRCAQSGYALFSEGKVYKLDEEGNKKVGALLKNTKSKKGLAVQVEGTVEGDTLHVTKIEEQAAT
ncbi:MAG TPA: hypothetical protein VJH03_17590 [Blastocatellia bacterium]|nr:hypothetical protein [Blastocatellia bacterium]